MLATGITTAAIDTKAETNARSGAGYQETEHVRRAYEVAGF